MNASRRTIINVSNRLPVTVGEQGIKRSSGGLVAALEGVAARFNLAWVGWPGPVSSEEADHFRQVLVEERGFVPVFLDPHQSEGHYEGFSNSSLWPLLHYMPSKFAHEAHWWDAYSDVNRRFAQEVLARVKRGDEMVWVHDYHLMLLPRLLKQERPSLRVGFFLHTPFPSYEVFRCHPHREELVEGMLGADLVGFHTIGYMRHFRSTAMRLLDLEADVTQIRRADGHTTRLGVYPIGINSQSFAAELANPLFGESLGQLAAAHAGKRVVLSAERLDYSKGLTRRLDAIEHFLRKTGRAAEMRFIFVAVPSRETVDEYRRLREEVEQHIGHINGEFATTANTPVQFVHRSIPFTELCALYALAEVALVTPVSDGMNLVAKEYVACQRPSRDVDPGVLVLSEFAGAAEVLFDALVVNPYDVAGVSAAIETALQMPRHERERRMNAMRDRVMRFDAAWWARSFLGDLERIPAPAAPANGTRRCSARDVGQRLGQAIREKRRVALFLDYDGTLREIVRDPSAAAPTPEVRALLEEFGQRPNLWVTIISGRTPQDLESFLGNYEDFGLIAEHGAALRRPGSGGWEQLDRNVSYRWKEEVAPILRLYEETTPGSFVEEKRTSLVWHYRRADPEFGEWKARQLVDELEAVVANQPLSTRLGRKIVEVTATQVNKGAAVTRVLEGQEPFDLIVVAGDDTTDESMYQLELRNLVSINVALRQTHAQCVLPDPAALRKLLMESLRT